MRPLALSRSGRLRYPPAPAGCALYVIGDIHGRSDLLEKVLRAIDRDMLRSHASRTAEIYLGDYIDRGPNSAGVISRLIARAGEVHTIFLRGNHEQMLMDFVDGRDCWDPWKAIGAIATLSSYGVPSSLLSGNVQSEVLQDALARRLPPEHVEFYAQTGSYCRVGSYVMVHAGVRPGIDLEDQSVDDLLGVRQEFLRFAGDLGFIVVHGHTPVRVPDMRPNRINIDTGAFATNRLTCLRIDQSGATVLES